MVGVAEDYLGFYVVGYLAGVDGFDRACGADGHEDGGLDGSVVGCDCPGASICLCVGGLEGECH